MVKSGHGKVRVFVYGTLKLNHINHELLREAKADFLGHDTITGHFSLHDVAGAYPALITRANSEPEREVYGQIFAVNSEGLAALDHLEGHPYFFERTKLRTNYKQQKVWVYFLKPENEPGFGTLMANEHTDVWNPLQQEVNFWKSQGREFDEYVS